MGLENTPILASLISMAGSLAVWLFSASNKRTNDRFKEVYVAIAEAKQAAKEIAEAEERRRTESLRDLDARTVQAIAGLRNEIMGRFDDLKSLITGHG